MNSSIKTHIVTLASMFAVTAASLAGLPASAAEKEPDAGRTLAVNYADLNLDNDKGAAVLFARLRQAAEAVCRLPADSKDLDLRGSGQACYDKAITAAVAQVNNQKVSAAYRASLGAKGTT